MPEAKTKDLTRGSQRQRVDFCRWDLEGNLVDVIKRLQDVMASIPEAYRASAAIDISAYDDYGSSAVSFEIEFTRPETDEELAARVFRQEASDRKQAEKERAEFERLKAKFALAQEAPDA